MKSQMRLADKFQAPYTLLLGKMEVKEGTIILRDMKAGKQKQMAFDDVIPEVIKLLGKENLDTYVMRDHVGED
ncbi:hypothetical protein EXS70_03850 [Candidatus Peribacteria bacterium]|nr:hypothetical protein [Candidatus Peribacteria bacterium]